MRNLQLFAEGDGNGTDGGNGDGAGANDGNDGGDKLLSFDDFLAQEGNQAEFDRRIQKATQTAVENAQKKWKAMTDDKLTEAEKLAKMTKEEKAEYRANKLEKELADMKRQNALSDMANTARKMLADEGINIPDELLSHLVEEDAEGTKAAVEAFANLFNAAVNEAVKGKARQETPKEGGRFNASKVTLGIGEMAREARIIK